MLYKQITDDRCSKYIAMVNSDLSKFRVPPVASDIKTMLKQRDEFKLLYRQVKDYVVPKATFDAVMLIKKQFTPELENYMAKLKSLEERYNKDIERAKADVNKTNEQKEKEARDSILPLTEKHAELLSYKEAFSSTMSKYNISPADMYISDELTKEEFITLLDNSVTTCKRYSQKSLNVSKYLNFLDNDDAILSAVISLGVFLALFLLLPVIGIGYIGLIFYNTGKMYKDIDNLKIASSLMYDMDFNRYIPNSEKKVLDVSEVEETYKKDKADIEASNPAIKMEYEVKEAMKQEAIVYVSDACKKVETDAESKKKALLMSIYKNLDELDKKIEDMRKNSVKLGDSISTSPVLTTEMIMGTLEGVVPVKIDYGLTNLNLVSKYDDTLLNTIKLMFCNMLLNVCAKNLEVTIFDPEYMGQAFAEFLTPTIMKYIKVDTSDASRLYDEMRKRESESILICKNTSVQSYNEHAASIGMLPRNYYLYIFLTGLDDKFEKNKVIMEFLKHSANYGIIVWTVYPKQLSSVQNIQLPIKLDGSMLKYDFELGSKVVHTFEDGVENRKIVALDYRKSYLMRYLPEDKWYSGNSTKGINIRPGLVDGDPGKAYTHQLCDGEVHFLLGGATGAGKSVAIDCIMQSMCHEYPPDEMQLVYIDMKNVEVAKYTKDEYSLIPHALILAGTTDGEYCLSVFDWVFNEMLRRSALCSRYGVQKVEDLRKKFDNPKLSNYNPEVHCPRIILLVDEFQVLFDASRLPMKIIDRISQRIESMVRLARAAAIHLWFTSQDMSGTVSKKVLDNFSMRGALRCTKEVSVSLLGNEASGKIKDKVGWMYTNNSAGQDPSANKLWKVPYAPGDDLINGMKELGEKCVKENRMYLRTKFYDEKKSRTEADLAEAYNSYPQFKDGRIFVLGDRTVYSTNVKPANFRLMDDANENILHVAFERQDMMNVASTLIRNIIWSDDASLLINCSDRDTITLMELEKYTPEGWEDFLYPDYETEDIFEDISSLIEDRTELEKDERTPLYILLVNWEKRSGIGRDENYKLVESLNSLIFEANKVNIHFVFIGQSASLPTPIINMCNHRLIAKVDDKTASRVTTEMSVAKYPTANGDDACFCLYQYGTTLAKFKIYKFTYTRKLEAREI